MSHLLDLARATAFYDALIPLLGAKRLYSTKTLSAWGTSADGPTLMVTLPHDGAAATIGNGGMVALSGKNRATVDAVHAKALELGARDEGPPGPRGTSGFYAGYFRDLDGNKLNVFVAG